MLCTEFYNNISLQRIILFNMIQTLSIFSNQENLKDCIINPAKRKENYIECDLREGAVFIFLNLNLI